MTVKAIGRVSGGPYHNSSTTYDLDVAVDHLATGTELTVRVTDLGTGLVSATLASEVKDQVKAALVAAQLDTFGLLDTVQIIGATL